MDDGQKLRGSSSGFAKQSVGTEEIAIPLVVDLDETLVRSDTLIEAVCRLAASRPAVLLRLPFWLLRGRAALKSELADRALVDPSTVPLSEELLAYIREEKCAGRRIYIASAADTRQAEAVAGHVGLFDGVFGSNLERNLKGRAKADVLVAEFGERGFDYAGDAAADLAVWKHARRALAVNASEATIRALQRQHDDVAVISRRQRSLRDYIRAIRVHQWTKNGLLALPLLAAHETTLPNVLLVLLGAVAFSLVASSVYLTNDLLDLPADRDHATKRTRPLASGAVPLAHALVFTPVLLFCGLGLASLVSLPFLGVVGFYFAITASYSLFLKRQPIVDVLTLAGLYTLRVVAGGVALAIPLSAWLLGFSMFLFFCLALIKRHAELKSRVDSSMGDPRGRGYRLADMGALGAMSAASGYAAVVVMALYVNSETVTELYARPWGMWLACVLLLYWISRILLVTHRGQMHDDPVVFALKDRASLVTAVLVVVVALVSAI